MRQDNEDRCIVGVSRTSARIAEMNSPYLPMRSRSARKCGAVALARAYDRLGLPQSIERIWTRIAMPDRRGGVATASYRLVKDAASRGFHAMGIKFRDPVQLLNRFADFRGFIFIACHRLRFGSSAGHFSVIEDASSQRVMLWSGSVRPCLEYQREEFIRLWSEHRPDDEFSPRVAVVLRKSSSGSDRHRIEQPGSMPEQTSCLRCGKPFSLALLNPLFGRRAGSKQEIQRGWDAIFCPHCDAAHR